MYVVETNNLVKKFGQLTAVNRISLKINEGEIFGLLGPNGAGKTTTLSMLATLQKPTSGNAFVGGHSIITEPLKVRKSIGMVFQEPSSDDELTGKDNLYLHALLYGVPKHLISGRIKEALELVDLTNRQNEMVRRYSGGMRRRLELARGLLHEPKILFLDEPTLGLDPQTRVHIWTYIKKLVKERKVTIIVTTHYMEEADELCDRVAIVDRGRIVALDAPAKLKRALGGDVIRLKVSNPNMAALKKLKFVKRIKKDGDFISLSVNDSGTHLQEILKKAGKVESVESRSPTLDDVFLHYTGREIRDTEAEGGWFERMIASRSR